MVGGGNGFGLFNYATDAPNTTGAAIAAASQRWANAPAGGLVQCGSGTTPSQDLLPLGLQLTHTSASTTCVSAEITYEGNPLEAAELVLTTADGRVDPAGTNATGQTQMCLQNGPAITSFKAYAEVSSPITTASLTTPNMAVSPTYTCPIGPFRTRGRLSPATVISFLALFITLAGGILTLQQPTNHQLSQQADP